MIEIGDPSGMGFEQAFASLQEVVERLERGSLPLDECVALFELGNLLVGRCNALLDQAELRLTTLTQDGAGGLDALAAAGRGSDGTRPGDGTG